MALTGLTGDVVHSGSWGTPDFGLTEYLSNYFNQGRTAQGGSNLQGDQSQTVLAPATSGQYTPLGSAGAYGIQGSYTAPRTTTPTYTAPQQTTTNTSQNRLDMWRALGRSGEPPVGWNGESSGTPGIDYAAIDAIYNPTNDYLNQLEQSYRSQLPGAQATIEGQYGQGLQELSANQQEQQGQLDTQKTSVDQSKASALARARQLYSELSQRNQAMFGGRNSAGQFAGELLGRETQKNFGNIDTAAQNAYAELQQANQKLLNWASTQKLTLANQRQKALDDLQTAFQNQMMQIAANRAQNESAKAAARLDALNQAKAQAFQIQQADAQFNRQLEMYQIQQQDALKNKYTAATNTGIDTKALSAMSQANDYVQNIFQTQGSAAAAAAAKQLGVQYSGIPVGYVQEWDPTSQQYVIKKQSSGGWFGR